MKLRDHDAILAKSDAFRVDPRLLKIEAGFNVRDLEAPAARPALNELKESVRSEGVQVPLEIRLVAEDLYVVSGHRRLKVVMELIAEGHEILSVPAIAEPRVVSEADRTARLITLNQGEPLTGLEKGEVVRRLIAYGWDRANIAQRLGFKTVKTVADYELLLSAPEPLREAVRDGELSASNAVMMVREAQTPEAATQTLAAARTEATARGKTKITAQSMTTRKTPAPAQSAARPEPEPVRRQAKVDQALNLLAEVVHSEYPAATAASVYLALKVEEVTPLVEWLMEFEVALRARAYKAEPELV